MVHNKILEKIYKYFKIGYTYREICHMLEKKHKIQISLRTLKRILNKLSLKRKCTKESPEILIAEAITIELEDGACNLGYRAMCQRIRKEYQLDVRQKTVAKLLKKIDPKGVADRLRYRLRRRVYSVKGPNFLWHTDGYDKLKRYGFAIHGCIDGFSKKLIWLQVATSNNNPEVIGFYYMQAISKLKYLPTIIRSDHGTENTLIELFHKALRYNHNDEHAKNCFLLGKSTHNQRIESYWRQLKRQMAGFYINLFKNMLDEGVLDIKNSLKIECLRFCFGSVIQNHLEMVRKEWNEHKIRKQNPDIEGGKPNILYHWPEKYGGIECKKEVLLDDISILKEKYVKINPVIYNSKFEELVKLVKPNCAKPETAEDAYILYNDLLSKFNDMDTSNYCN